MNGKNKTVISKKTKLLCVDRFKREKVFSVRGSLDPLPLGTPSVNNMLVFAGLKEVYLMKVCVSS